MAETQVKDFPRGGAQVLTPLEARKIRSIAEKDVLFKVQLACNNTLLKADN